ncbi:MAG: DUF3768 domain-containing protein [Devosia sp.]|nr:DUF3768 domain-containing protein [Devosia sp.]
MSDDNAAKAQPTPNPTAAAAAVVADDLTHPVCSHCGSDDVARDAWANWDPQARDWKVQQVFDQAFCFACDGETKLDWVPGACDSTSRIRDLNDALRRNRGATGRLVCTAGVGAEGPAFVAAAVNAVALFDAFDADNDLHGEHDFGTVEVEGKKLFFKVDYFDPSLSGHSADSADWRVTVRVLTIMLAEEY